MNKHLKPGVAVDVRGASDEVKEQVMAAFVAAGAKRDKRHGQSCPDLQHFAYWDEENDVWFASEMHKTVISIEQALGRESEVENTWFERGELPPVGTEVKLSCPEFDRDHDFEFDGTEAEILLHRTTDNGNKVAVFVSEHGDYHALVARCFRPLKTEKEKFVEFALSLDCDPSEGMLSRHDYAARLYDKGLRFPE